VPRRALDGQILSASILPGQILSASTAHEPTPTIVQSSHRRHSTCPFPRYATYPILRYAPSNLHTAFSRSPKYGQTPTIDRPGFSLKVHAWDLHSPLATVNTSRFSQPPKPSTPPNLAFFLPSPRIRISPGNPMISSAPNFHAPYHPFNRQYHRFSTLLSGLRLNLSIKFYSLYVSAI